MLFNSYSFLFFFLPLTLLAYHLLRHGRDGGASGRGGALSGVLRSWDPRYLALLVPSLVINSWLGGSSVALTFASGYGPALAGNLVLIGWFKYRCFLPGPRPGARRRRTFSATLPYRSGFHSSRSRRSRISSTSGAAHPKAASFGRFAFFVLFFPQLIAGPIVLFRNFDRQTAAIRAPRLVPDGGLLGVLLFAIGLFKKVVFADSLGFFADEIFAFAAGPGISAPRCATPGSASLAYALQIYFDFSGYSDMAIGLAADVRLPPAGQFQLAVPRRQHHRFLAALAHDAVGVLREYVYIPLGGNRHGAAAQAVFT